MKSSKTKSKIIIAGVIALVLFLGYCYLYWDFLQTNAEISTSAAEINQSTNEESRVITLRQTVDSFQKDQSLLDSLFVPNDKVADFIQSIESLADTSGVTHTISLDIQPDSSLSSYNKELLQFHMTTSGTWKNSIRFISLLENTPYKLYIGSVELSQDTGGKRGSAWNGNFDFTVVKNK